ncbi:MAG: hypothetical protein N3A68_09255 [Bacteroidia bacterium]|nr:hypothetical protein [Bacteroidia bacterium]GIV23960.1 MAG: hypothetical protein KatS3mg025_1619 [Bacteroidia bacterium]
MRTIVTLTCVSGLMWAQNVGIGTAAPVSRLHVAGTNATLTVGPFGIGEVEGRIVATGLGAEVVFVRRTLSSWPTTPAAGDRFAWYNPNGTARLWTHVTGDLVTVTATGNVGIGTTAPHVAARLHVAGTNMGVLLPATALTSATAWAPLGGTSQNGMIVYNTATSGSGQDAVSPGYYYWLSGRWRRFIDNGYAGMVQGVLATPPQSLVTNPPSWQYLNSYIDLPPGRWIVFSTQLLHPAGGPLPSNASIWVRTTFCESDLTFLQSGDIIGSPLISGLLPSQSWYSMATGQIIIQNNSGGVKRYYYWGHSAGYNTTANVYYFATDYWGENQFFALPAE